MFYDYAGTPLTIAYDYAGNIISGKVPHTQLAMLAGISDSWKANCNTVYQTFTARIKAVGNPIPFFITTDQHGRRLDGNRYFNNIDTVEAVNIQLGDNCTDYYNSTELSINRVDCKAVANMVSVIGNHDVKLTGGETVEMDAIRKAFCYDSSRLDVSELDSDTSYCYVVIDEDHAVKYIALDLYGHATAATAGTNLVSTEVVNWLIAELLKDDYDCIMLNHQRFKDSGNVDRNGTAQTAHDDYAEINALWAMFQAFNSRSSGALTDTGAVEHQYDFSGVEHRILCALHGHWHYETYLVDGYMTAYTADWYGDNNSAVMGVIDRENDAMYIYKFDSTQIFDELKLDICKAITAGKFDSAVFDTDVFG